jgi:membrane associated rhomboid family serine protease
MIPLRDSQPSDSRPIVTSALIAVNVLVFLYAVSLDPFSANHFISGYAVIPARFEPWTLVTSMFLHGGWLHLIGNMWFLWIFGDNVEDILGRSKYLLFYLLTGAAAALAHLVLNPESRIPMVGASGAIAGVMGAYMVKFPRARIVTLIFIVVFITTVELPASVLLVYWLAIQVFSGVGSIGYSSASGGIAWFAHVGGFLAGVALILVIPTARRYRRRPDLRW